MTVRVGIVTISDRASQGVYQDLGGPAMLLILSVAMTFGFWILLKNSDEL